MNSLFVFALILGAVLVVIGIAQGVVFLRGKTAIEDETSDDLIEIAETAAVGTPVQGPLAEVHAGCLAAYQASDFDHVHPDCFDAIGRVGAA